VAEVKRDAAAKSWTQIHSDINF